MQKRHMLIYVCLAAVSAGEHSNDSAIRLACEAREEDIPETFNEIETFANVAMTYMDDRKKDPEALIPSKLAYLMPPSPEEVAMRAVGVINKFSKDKNEEMALLARIMEG